MGFSTREFTMKLVWVLLLMVLYDGHFSNGANTNVSKRPEVVNIGSIFSFKSMIGKVAKVAIEAAVQDVNSNPDVLRGTELNITMHDTNFSGFRAIIEAFQFMGNEAVAVIGPQSSVMAHIISHVSNELQVPLLSFSASDPTLSSLQYPFFVRTTQNDLFQMAAIANIIAYYEWRQVIAIYTDDDHGRNGIASLADELAASRCTISYKAALITEASRAQISDVLINVALMESRIIVVHTYSDAGLDIFSVAQHLGMLDSGYVWLATNWLSTILDTDSPLGSGAISSIQGLITLRMYTPDTALKQNFVSRWNNLTRKETASGPLGLSTYGLCAYDTVWLLAHAIDAFFNNGGNISFSKDPRLNGSEGSLNLDAMSVFNEGNLLLNNIREVNTTGLTGPINFTLNKNLVHPAFEVINVIGTGVRKIGYWSNYSGLSVLPPDTLYMKPPNLSSSTQQLHSVIWPGQTTVKPWGWVFPQNGRHLRIGVPNRVGYREFVGKVSGTNAFEGYCIDVFTAALNLLPYAIPYKFFPFEDGVKNPSPTDLVRMITSGVSIKH
ncbi:hypothetical protein LguiA_005587 [Lonicera macranthoides]